MPHARINGVDLSYEEAGEGHPVIWCHEFAGDYRSWESQVRYFSRLYRNVTWNYRGYPPSAVLSEPQAYSQELLVADLLGLMDHLGIQQAHLVGLSMGGSLVVSFALEHPQRCRSIVAAGTGSGTTEREQFERDVHHVVEVLLNQGMQALAEFYTRSPSRQPLLRKDPRGWEEFHEQFAAHSALGSARTMQAVQLKRPTIFQLGERLKSLRVPTLVLVGDEDEACIEPSVFLKRNIASAGMVMLPQSGHTLNLEEPGLFNQTLEAFFHAVEHDKWAAREEVTTSLLPGEARR